MTEGLAYVSSRLEPGQRDAVTFAPAEVAESYLLCSPGSLE